MELKGNILRASEGMYLYNGTSVGRMAPFHEDEDSLDNWQEISEEEAEVIKAERKAEREKAVKARIKAYKKQLKEAGV